MATFHFELVAPEKLLFSGDVEQVDVPGAEGDFGVLKDHAPLIAMLRPGVLTIHGTPQGTMRVVVSGGFAETNPGGLTVLADQAVLADDFDRAALGAEIEATERQVASATDDRTRDRLANRIDQLRMLQATLGAGAAAGH